MLTVAALYKFTRFPDPAALRAPLLDLCQKAGVRGILLLAPEGVNGTVAGSAEGVAEVLAHIRALPGCADADVKFSAAGEQPFGRIKVRLKREIVTLGRPEADPTRRAGTYVEAAAWNALIGAPDVAVIDTRNDYEVAIGSFDGAINPATPSFGAFPDWWANNRDRFHDKRIAMFCTGGIRCEKSTAFLRAQGVDEVYHLRGGILKYLETVPEDESLWRGECFVFDQRVSLGHGLRPGSHDLCHACRRPVSPQDMESPDFEDGVSCPACIATLSEADRARFRERQTQIRLARARGVPHLGATLARKGPA